MTTMRVMAVFLVAVALNYGWEMAQCPLFEPPRPSEARLHCFWASLGDGVMVLTIFAIVSARRWSFGWIVARTRADDALTIASGVVLAVLVESAALFTGRWEYRTEMPLLPGTSLGVLPILQMVLLPPVVFRVAGWLDRAFRRMERNKS
jgi:hypothetical protein